VNEWGIIEAHENPMNAESLRQRRMYAISLQGVSGETPHNLLAEMTTPSRRVARVVGSKKCAPSEAAWGAIQSTVDEECFH
jgi:hypothetical protein